MFHLLLLLPVVLSASDFRCLQCSSPVLKNNWEITSLPILPKGLPFDALCDTALETITTKEWLVNCPNSMCFEMIFSVDSEPAFLRGCYENFFSANITEFTNNAALCQYSQLAAHTNITGTIQGNHYSGLAVSAMAAYPRQKVTFAPNAMMTYHAELFTNQGQYFKTCEVKKVSSCLSCSRLGGVGSCDASVNTTCNGAYCTRMEGSYGNEAFEIRGCSPINPLSGEHCSWMGFSSSIYLQDHALSADYKADHCYCSGERCNEDTAPSSAPNITTTSPTSPTDFRCLQCSSPELKDDWEATSLPVLPNGLPFDSLCDTAEENMRNHMLVDCPNSVCFEMIITKASKPAFLRGCYENFLHSFTSSPNNATLRQYNTIEGQTISGIVHGKNLTGPAVGAKAVYSRHPVNFIPNNEMTYREELFNNQSAYFSDYEDMKDTSCLSCSRVGGVGRCDAAVTTTCTGAYCTHIEGIYGKNAFEIRGCSPINPLNGNECSWLNYSTYVYVQGHTIPADYEATHCYCSGDRCNKDLTVVTSTIITSTTTISATNISTTTISTTTDSSFLLSPLSSLLLILGLLPFSSHLFSSST